MRIVGGKYEGRELLSPKDFRVRPTAEHVRAAVLDMLASDLKDARVLDLFAGTGALGLEAMSRGAKYCDFVEDRPSSLHSLKANVVRCQLQKKSRVFKKDALRFAGALAEKTYDLAFCDPPYSSRMLDRVIDHWKENHFSKILVCQHATDHELPRGKVTRRFDETTVTIYR